MGIGAQPEQKVGKRQGKLTIFASYFSGAGKSYSMLKAAEKDKQAGLDVVVGLLSCNQWPQTKIYHIKQCGGTDKWSMKWIWMLV